MTRKPKPTRDAKSISVHVCEHGTLYLHLHDRAGNVFARACLGTDAAVAFADDVVDRLQTHIEGGGEPCAGVH
jgi:hypothetical protein